jgi:CRISPR/Cas system CMR subunit Cmr4 (Cas7 group RAMP superfamily)
MNSRVGRLWKKWPLEAEADSRAIVRIDGRRYERRLVRVGDPKVFAELAGEIERKYKVPASQATVDEGGLWLFELAPRES